MTKSRRLKPVVRVSEAREQDFARRLSQAMDLWRVQQARLEELEHHRAQYENTLRRESARGVDAARLRHYQQFLDRLADAVAFQQRRVAELERACAQARAVWMAANQRRRTLEKVAQRYTRAEREAEARREQRETDDRPRHSGNGEEKS